MLTTFAATVLAGLKKGWDWCKPHLFQMLLTAIVTYALFTLFKSGSGSLSSRIDAMEKIHTEEIRKINDAQAEERKTHEENMRRLEQQLNEVQQRHDAAIKALEEQKAKQTEKLIKVYGGDPAGMAQQVSETTGFPVFKQR